jgi:hypothetical protein
LLTALSSSPLRTCLGRTDARSKSSP